MLKEKQVQYVLESQEWIFAKTMANIPHSYTIKKKWDSSALYEACFHYINKHGIVEYFYGKPYKYLYLGNYKYWAMTDDVNVSGILNRVEVNGKAD